MSKESATMPTRSTFKDLTGKTFERWTVIDFKESKNERSYWNCLCQCGTSRVVLSQNLLNGISKSCGCLARDIQAKRLTTHGGCGHRVKGKRRSKPPEYQCWTDMNGRCNNPKHKNFFNYGGRGIKICERWKDFANFLADMGPRAGDHNTIERIDNSKGYSPTNCRWATWKHQLRNTRRNVNVTINGVTRCVAEWAEIKGVNAISIHSRIRKGWDGAAAVTTPFKAYKKKI